MDRTHAGFHHVQAWMGYFFVAPATFLILVIYAVPIVLVLLVSFTDYTLVSDYFEFVGLENYARMFSDAQFARALVNTLIYAAIFLPASFCLSLVIAIALQERKQFKSILEVLYFLPVTSTLTAMALVWSAMMDSRQGIINNLLQSIGAGPFNFLGSEQLVLVSLAIISIWSIVGFNMVLFLAGLSAIPKGLYEAATMDGADHPLDRFLKVTWPMLGPTAMFVAVTSSITAFKLFDPVALLTRGGPNGASEVFLYLAFLEGFEYFNLGYSAALSLFFLIVIFIFALFQAFFVERKVHY
ncbi:sugar ABC transporter permease [Chelativorans sp. M5D2P16]|uniref:carbohydrate ABC transporter permease n=1 Tax=Chelativorans sp. M5D2P16 TaxID=3095678 RepID=UPI002ACA6B9A|nr:sugar ABC transporter permease [Chelativorans sp. M5D2P16]MDZ5696681.1 sugar ABC transporter permease [Chelativorans sp. M5D2P16]